MRIFSGIQPTGEIHIGNYFGAIKQWTDLQEQNECLFCIVDLHAITVPYDTEKLQSSITEKIIAYLAAGIDPEKTIIFVQSKIKEHAELCWLLSSVTPIGSLSRMTQYKEKTAKQKEKAGAGIFVYPVLMAADILLYDAQKVPVGEDQVQHIELSREVARKFNHRFGKTFTIPEAQVPSEGARIMSLADPKRKMSKSDPEGSYISLFDSPEAIKKKIGSAVTDTGKSINYNPQKKPGISNLLTIYSLFSGKSIGEIEKDMEKISYKEFKEELAKITAQELEIFRKKREEFSKRDVYVEEILKKGERRARQIAEEKMKEVKEKMGLQ